MIVFRKCFLVLMPGIIEKLRCSQFNTSLLAIKLPKQAYGLIFFKRGWKEVFKIGMQIYADECISLTGFIASLMFYQRLSKKSFKVLN